MPDLRQIPAILPAPASLSDLPRLSLSWLTQFN
jgi:hypothetical protein